MPGALSTPGTLSWRSLSIQGLIIFTSKYGYLTVEETENQRSQVFQPRMGLVSDTSTCIGNPSILPSHYPIQETTTLPKAPKGNLERSSRWSPSGNTGLELYREHHTTSHSLNPSASCMHSGKFWSGGEYRTKRALVTQPRSRRGLPMEKGGRSGPMPVAEAPCFHSLCRRSFLVLSLLSVLPSSPAHSPRHCPRSFLSLSLPLHECCLSKSLQSKAPQM